MSDRAHFDAEIAAGSAMLKAGNVEAAIRHCKAALDIRPDHIDAYELQVDILSAKDRPAEALRVTKARLETTPDCRWASLQEIRWNARLNRAGHAKEARDRVVSHFADDPMMHHDAHLMFDACFSRARSLLKRIRRLRAEGYWGVFNLAQLEQGARADAGHVFALGKLQQQDLEDGLIDAETLHAQAQVRYLQGRLLSARHLAAQAIDADPANQPLYAETWFSATLGLLPFMWPSQAFISLTGSFTSRFPWFVRMFLNYGIAIGCIMFLGVLLGPLSLIPGVPEDVSDTVIGVLLVLNIGWALYVIWAWGSVGRWRNRRRGVRLNEDY